MAATDGAGDAALLAQILSEVRAVGAKVSGIEVTVAQAVAEIRHRSTQADDHEDRLRALESRDVVTPSELAARDERATVQRRWLIGLLSTLTLFVVGEAVAVAIAIFA